MESPVSASAWNELIAALPGPHLLQSYQWGQVKARYGWQPFYLVWGQDQPYRVLRAGQELPTAAQAAALVLQRSVTLGGLIRLRMLYAPKGPLLDWENAALRERVLGDLRDFARRRAAFFIKIDPDVALGYGVPGETGASETAAGQAARQSLAQRGWRFSGEQIQFRNTVVIDLTPGEEALLARMKQKTRYNLRLAERKGVTVRVGSLEDFPLLYQMYAETSLRDDFVIREADYYRTVIEIFSQQASPAVEPLIAEVEGEAIAAVVIFRFAGNAWYIYGMSRAAQREKMPNYLLQWEAMRRAKAAGCTQYDLWGAPEVFDESDSLWGVFRFKEGLGGTVARYLGAWDCPVNAPVYRLYTQILPRLLDVMRRRGKAKT